MRNPLYTCYKLVSENLGYSQLYPNKYGTHCTIEFGVKSVHPNEGLIVELSVIGRLTTDKVDVLIVDSSTYEGKNKYPHITLSTANGIKPVESNREIELYYDSIVWFNPVPVLAVIKTVFSS